MSVEEAFVIGEVANAEVVVEEVVALVLFMAVTAEALLLSLSLASVELLPFPAICSSLLP